MSCCLGSPFTDQCNTCLPSNTHTHTHIASEWQTGRTGNVSLRDAIDCKHASATGAVNDRVAEHQLATGAHTRLHIRLLLSSLPFPASSSVQLCSADEKSTQFTRLLPSFERRPNSAICLLPASTSANAPSSSSVRKISPPAAELS